MTNRQSTQQPSVHLPPAPAGGVLQRACACGTHTAGGGECESCKRKRLQRFGTESAPDLAPPIVHEVLRASGQPLEPATRAALEPRFGHDFSRVRVHTDAHAAASARAVNALAYTVGSHVAFGSGRYAPGTPAGDKLIAHELAHVVQQRGAPAGVQAKLAIDAPQSAAEQAADAAANAVVAGAATPTLQAVEPVLSRQEIPTTPQQRGGQARMTRIDQPRRGEDEVHVHVLRYLCACAGRDVTRSSTSTRLQPGPGITYEFCRGRTTVRVDGEVVPSSFSTGRATVGVDVNVAPQGSSGGGRVRVEGEARNTGDEPQVGGRVSGRVPIPGGPDLAATGEVFGGTRTGRVDSRVGVGVRVGGVTITGDVTNPQDERRGVGITIGGPLGGREVERQICRECHCPVVYTCYEDVPPRDYTEDVTTQVQDTERVRYYFRLNTDRDTPDAGLRGESTRGLDRLSQLIADGWQVRRIIGHASPEAQEREVNEPLSLRRAERLRQIAATRLGSTTTLPQAEVGGELLGRTSSILPGSSLATMIFDAGFSGPEEVSALLVGDEIPNDQLAGQLLSLFQRIDTPDDRLRLFGVAGDSPVAPRLLAAIDQYIARGGRGYRPWETIFGYLRLATIELTRMRDVTTTEQRRTSGSIRRLGEALCNRHAQQAEREGRFGPAEAEPTNPADCPVGSPGNDLDYAARCDYR